MKNNRLIVIVVLIAMLIVYSVFFDVFTLNVFFHILYSLYRMIIGYLLSVCIGLSFAVIIGMSKYARMAFKPVLSFFISIPTITWVPVLLIITGISEKTIIIAIFLGSFFAIVYNTLDGFDNIDQNLIRVGKIFGYNNLKILFKISIPASLNFIIVGLKLGIAYSWRALVGAEMLGATRYGLGFLIFSSRKFYNIKRMLCSLALIGLLGYILNRLLVRFLEQKTIAKWGFE